MRSIGELARASGLSVSALRFYDGAGVLVPAVVDPATGYRRYAEHQVGPARLVAGLRRVGMPLPEIAHAVTLLPDTDAVHRLLDTHLRRLEDGLADARRELSRVRTLLNLEAPMSSTTTRLTVSGADLAAALGAVRFAVGRDPALPALSGVLFEVEAGALRLVATDRFRLAVGSAPAADVSGPGTAVLAPATFADELRRLLTGDGRVVLTLDAAAVRAETSGGSAAAEPLRYDFPDYRRLLRDGTGGAESHRVTVDVGTLRAALVSGAAPTVAREYHGTACEVAMLAADPDGGVTFVEPVAGHTDGRHVAVNREFLLQALDAGGRGQLVLELDGPIKPLAVRAPDDAGSFSILMPVRL